MMAKTPLQAISHLCFLVYCWLHYRDRTQMKIKQMRPMLNGYVYDGLLWKIIFSLFERFLPRFKD